MRLAWEGRGFSYFCAFRTLLWSRIVDDKSDLLTLEEHVELSFWEECLEFSNFKGISD